MKYSCLLFVLLSLSNAVFAADVYVNPTSGSDANDGSSSSPVQSISAAVGLMSGQTGTIHLSDGTHAAGATSVFIPNGVALEGAGSSTIVARSIFFKNHSGQAVVKNVKFEGGTLSVEYCTSASIQGCVFTNTGHEYMVALSVKNTDATISNCTSTGVPDELFFKVSGRGAVTFDNCDFLLTEYTFNQSWQISAIVEGQTDLTFRNCDIRYGIEIRSANTITITGCTIQNDFCNVWVMVDYAQSTTITNNTLKRNTEIAFQVSIEGVGLATVTGNTLNGGDIYCWDHIKEGSVASGNNLDGGRLGGAMKITGNTFTNGSSCACNGELSGNSFDDSTASMAYGIATNNTFTGASSIGMNRGSVKGNSFSGVEPPSACIGGTDNTVITGNTLSGTGPRGISSGGTIEGNTVSGFDRGISVGGDTISVRNNTIQARVDGIIQTTGYGSSEIIDNTVTISESGGQGIYGYSVIRGNTVSGPCDTGIAGQGSSSYGTSIIPVIVNNTVTGAATGIRGDAENCRVTGVNKKGTGVEGRALFCDIRNCEIGVLGRAENSTIADCKLGIKGQATECTFTGCTTAQVKKYSWDEQGLLRCTVTNCQTGPEWGISCDIVNCGTGAIKAEACEVSNCETGAFEGIESIFTSCDTGTLNRSKNCYFVDCDLGAVAAGNDNIFQGCGIGASSIYGTKNVFIGNDIGFQGSSFGGSGYNLFQANKVAINQFTGGSGAEKHNDFINNGVAVKYTTSGITTLNYRNNYWGSSQGPTLPNEEQKGDEIVIVNSSAYYINVTPYDTSPNFTGGIEYPGIDPSQYVPFDVEVKVSPAKGSPPLSVQASANVTEGGKPPFTYAWTIDGEEGVLSTSTSFSHTFTNEGGYAVWVTVKDSEGETTSAGQGVHVNRDFAVGSLTVRVYDHDNNYLPNAPVNVKVPGWYTMRVGSGITDSLGLYFFDKLPASAVTVEVDASGFKSQEKSVTIRDKQQASIEFKLEQTHAYVKKQELIDKLRAFPEGSSTNPFAAVEGQAESYINGAPQENVERLAMSEFAAWSYVNEAQGLSSEIASSMGAVLGSIVEAQQVSAKIKNVAIAKLPTGMKTSAAKMIDYVDSKLKGVYGELIRFAISSVPGTTGSNLRTDLESAALKMLEQYAGSGAGDYLNSVINTTLMNSFNDMMEASLEQSLAQAQSGSFGGTVDEARSAMITHMSNSRERTNQVTNSMTSSAYLKGLSSGLEKGAQTAQGFLTVTGVGQTFIPWVKSLEKVSSSLSMAADGWNVGVAGERLFSELPKEMAQANSIVYGQSTPSIAPLWEDAKPTYTLSRVFSNGALIRSASTYQQCIVQYKTLLNGSDADAAAIYLDETLFPAQKTYARRLTIASTALGAVMDATSGLAETDSEIAELTARLTIAGLMDGWFLIRSLMMSENLHLYLAGSYNDFTAERTDYNNFASGVSKDVGSLAFDLGTWLDGQTTIPAGVAFTDVEANPSVISESPQTISVQARVFNFSDSSIDDLTMTAEVLAGALAIGSSSVVAVPELTAYGTPGQTYLAKWTLQYTGPEYGSTATVKISLSTSSGSIYLPEPAMVFFTTVDAADTDIDGMSDSFEDQYGLDKNDSSDADDDKDGDGLLNILEYIYGTNPGVKDTDGDGLEDGPEVNTYLTDPKIADTDGGGVSDGDELDFGTDPLEKEDDTLLNTPTPADSPTPTPTAQPQTIVSYDYQKELLESFSFYNSSVRGDIMADGDTDLVMFGSARQLVIQNEGTGNFTKRELYSSWGNYPRYTNADVGDIDGDGQPEIVGVASDDAVWQEITDTYFSEATAIFDDGTTYDTKLLDVDKDGDQDVLIGRELSAYNNLPRLLIYKNNGKGVFTDASESLFDSSVYTNIIPYLGIPYGMSLTDANGDGYEDIFAGTSKSTSGSLSLFYNATTGKYEDASDRFPEGIRNLNFRNVYGADLDMDGDKDLVLLSGMTSYSSANKKIMIYLNDGTDNYTLADEPIVQNLFETYQMFYSGNVILADFDNDGDIDIFSYGLYKYYTLWTSRLYINNTYGRVQDGQYLFTDVTDQMFGVEMSPYMQARTIGAIAEDFDADGDLDLLLVNQDTSAVLLTNNAGDYSSRGGIMFSVATQWSKSQPVGPKLKGDLNEDGSVNSGDLYYIMDR